MARSGATLVSSLNRDYLKTCPCCKEDKPNVIQRKSMTSYHWDGKGEDPNDPGEMCDECDAGYIEHWNEMWREYWSSQGR